MTETTHTQPPFFPVRRALARLTDYLLWGLIIAYGLTHAFNDEITSLDVAAKAFFFSFVLFIFIEALFIRMKGTTPGKKLWGIRILPQNGTKITYMVALKRSAYVFVFGIGLFLPLISFLCPLYHWHQLTKGNSAFWDISCQTEVVRVKQSFFDKGFLVLFYGFLVVGCLLTLYITSKNYINFQRIEEETALSFSNEIQPMMQKALSETALSTPQSIEETAANLERIQQAIHVYQENFSKTKQQLERRIDKYPEGPLKSYYRKELAETGNRLQMLFMAQSIHISMFENILGFFIAAEGKYVFEDGRPVFQDPELMRQYENYLQQMELLLYNTSEESAGASAEE